MGYNEARALMNQHVPIEQRVCAHVGQPDKGPCSGPRIPGSPRIELCLRAEARDPDNPPPMDEIAPDVWVEYSDDPDDYIALCPRHHTLYDRHGEIPDTKATRRRIRRTKREPRPVEDLSQT